MTQVEKLEALVRKAIDGGLKPKSFSWIPEDEKALLDYWFTADNYKAVIFNHDFARALFGEEKKEWLSKFLWYSNYEQDSETFKDANDLLSSWVYSGGGPKPTVAELEGLPSEGIEECAGTVEKRIETTNKGFKYHLQQAVISKDPIDYMYKAVFGEG